ncbi:exoenzyme regulatory protein aepA precursor [Vallitalea longa]|uniref:Exoenzyme regulatory protein aepA n=1 Tax=Vallitalea longa TaxID=2936439 RepID=A0A9W6DE56_9FIRM|nr:amidohydrolase [Vallitalea longa]GKX29776.1 exoenzyme regulatory protein aepA precursor [Vallitalea longa]
MDIILYNGKVVTMDDDKLNATGVCIKGNKIYEVGNDTQVLEHKKESTILIDLKGRSLLPGFNDSHMHLINFAYTNSMVKLSKLTSVDAIISKAKEYIGYGYFCNGWIMGRGWNQNNFHIPKMLDRFDLDRISVDKPVCFIRACGHVLVTNSYALKLLGITSDTPQIEGGHFDLDDNNDPTGVFRENAMNMVYNKMPSPTKEEIKDMIFNACEIALSEGITSIQTDDLDNFPDNDYEKIIQAYKELRNEEKLPVRIYEQCLLGDVNILEEFLEKGYKTGIGDDFFKIGPLKILADGSLGARTAYLSEPYEDDKTTCGIGKLTQCQLDALIDKAHKNDMQIAIHCIGDQIMNMAFSSIKKALNNYPRKDHRHGIVHSQITTKQLLDDFRDSEVIAYIQPIFLDGDINIVEKRIGKDRAKYSYNFKKLINMGIHTPYGSDCPVEPFNVLHGIYCAVTRKTLEGFPKDGWLPEQKVTLQEALSAFTREGAYASFDENLKGIIKEGMLADLVVLDKDILIIDHDNIKDIKVDLTIVNGNIGYERD